MGDCLQVMIHDCGPEPERGECPECGAAEGESCEQGCKCLDCNWGAQGA